TAAFPPSAVPATVAGIPANQRPPAAERPPVPPSGNPPPRPRPGPPPPSQGTEPPQTTPPLPASGRQIRKDLPPAPLSLAWGLPVQDPSSSQQQSDRAIESLPAEIQPTAKRLGQSEQQAEQASEQAATLSGLLWDVGNTNSWTAADVCL